MMRAHSQHWQVETGKPACGKRRPAHMVSMATFVATWPRYRCVDCEKILTDHIAGITKSVDSP